MCSLLWKASCKLSDLEIETVVKFLIAAYKSTHPDFPCESCTGCSIALSKKRKDVDFEIPALESYGLERKVGLQSVVTCSCRICTVAKRNGQSVLQLSRKKCKQSQPTSKLVPSQKFQKNRSRETG